MQNLYMLSYILKALLKNKKKNTWSEIKLKI